MCKKNVLHLLIVIIISIALMAVVDSYIQPEYLIKSIIKMFLFLFIPILYALINKKLDLIKFFHIESVAQIKKSLLLGLGIYGIIMATYFVLMNFISLDNIQDILSDNLNVSKSNFLYVAIYISFINSLLEEFFFRGFIFLNLNKTISRQKAYGISAFAFAIYHVAILSNWFSPIIFIISMLGLFIGGLIFNWLNEKNENLYSSWLVHMFANFAINTVGFIMYNII